MTVSRSTMHIASPVSTSIITLLNFVSLCVTRSGILPLAMPRGDQNQRAPGNIARVLGFELFAQMNGDARHVLHHGERIFENAFVDLLMDVTNARAALVVSGGVGFVDVSDLQRFGVQDFA